MTDTASSQLSSPQELGFSASLAELEGIVDELESERLDVDRLGSQVERAAELVEFCRGELDATRMKVTEILERLAPASTNAPDSDGSNADLDDLDADAGGTE